MKNPCNGCIPPKRHLGCHGHCPDYIEWATELEKKRKYIRLAKEDEMAQTDYRDQAWHKVKGWRTMK